jgi:hypothetical protein
MDEHLKLLADASLEVEAAEEAIGDDAFLTARERLDTAGAVLEDLRSRWPAMGAAERALVGPAAKDVRVRLDAASARLPRFSALTETAAVVDREQDEEPAA